MSPFVMSFSGHSCFSPFFGTNVPGVSKQDHFRPKWIWHLVDGRPMVSFHSSGLTRYFFLQSNSSFLPTETRFKNNLATLFNPWVSFVNDNRFSFKMFSSFFGTSFFRGIHHGDASHFSFLLFCSLRFPLFPHTRFGFWV